MHFEGFRITPPPALLTSAPVGQAAAQEGSSQALQTITLYPRSTPPMLETWIADLDNPPSLNLREQANMQDMQPTHFSTSVTLSLGMPARKPRG